MSGSRYILSPFHYDKTLELTDFSILTDHRLTNPQLTNQELTNDQ